MEKKTQNRKSDKEEIKLLTFQPQQMQDEIEKLNEQVYSLTMENRTLNMINLDLRTEFESLSKRVPKSLSITIQDILLSIFGGQWEEQKE